MLELILVTLSFIFPIVYIFHKKGNEKFLFIASCIGVSTIVDFLIMILLNPFLLISLFVLPQLDAHEYLGNIKYLVSSGRWVAKSIFGLIALLIIPVSIFIYKKYEIFQKNT